MFEFCGHARIDTLNFGDMPELTHNLQIFEGTAEKVHYYYDDLNQLIREDNVWVDKTITYSYSNQDNNGGNRITGTD